MVTLLPRLPPPAAEILLDQHMPDGFTAWSGFGHLDLPEAIRFAATGGSPVSPTQLAVLRDRMLRIARSNGLGATDTRASHAKFDAQMAAMLAEDPLFASGEALRDDVWTFVGTSLAPDIVNWRFGAVRERYLGGMRNTFQRLWMRGRALDRGPGHRKRWQLLDELTEDALVQITERPSLGGDPVLARAIAEAWLRASQRHGRGAMEPIMRRAALRIRIWNEIRSLADLPSGELAGILDTAFDIPAELGFTTAVKVNRKPPEADPTKNLHHGAAGDEADSHQIQFSEKNVGNSNHDVSLSAMRVLATARERGWISPKSAKALNSLQEGQLNLASSEQNALDYLLSRLRSAALLNNEVSLLSRAVGLPASPSDGRAAVDPPSSTRKRSRAILRAR